MDNRIIKLNVGGSLFMTTYTTLASQGKNALTAMLDNINGGRVTSTLDENGYLFIDRCGNTFLGVLNYLRSGIISPPKGITKEQLFIELDYFSISLQKEHIPPGAQIVKNDRKLIRESLIKSIKENEEKLVSAMRLALADGENCLDIIPAISHSLEPSQIDFKRESGFNKLFGSQVRDELFLDELCSQLEIQVFGCPVNFGVKELRNFTDGTRAKVITVHLNHFLHHQRKT